MSQTTILGYTPQFSITKDGEDITASFKDRIVSLRVESREGGGDADTVSIGIDDRGWTIGLPSIGENSTTLSVSMGYAETAMYDLGSFQVDEVALTFPPKGLTLTGNSVSMNSNVKAPMIVSYDGQTLGQIVGQIATTAGVTAVVDPDLASIQIPYLNQSSSSGHLLATLESRYDALAKFSDGKLSFTKRGTGLSASGQSIGSAAVTAEDLLSYDIKLSNRNSYSQVKAGWWDKDANQMQYVQSTVAGAAGSTVPFLIKKPYIAQDEAQAAANAQMSVLNRKAKTGTITLAKGDPSLRGGQTITVTGTRDGVDGTYQIRTATHTLAKAGGLQSVLDVYDDGGDDSGGATDGQLDVTGLPATTLPVGGIGHM